MEASEFGRAQTVGHAKKPYAPPDVRDFGTVEEMTGGAGAWNRPIDGVPLDRGSGGDILFCMTTQNGHC